MVLFIVVFDVQLVFHFRFFFMSPVLLGSVKGRWCGSGSRDAFRSYPCCVVAVGRALPVRRVYAVEEQDKGVGGCHHLRGEDQGLRVRGVYGGQEGEGVGRRCPRGRLRGGGVLGGGGGTGGRSIRVVHGVQVS
ncbi:unnamed protein product [Ectocarpus sp. 4 AP-2014]